MAAQTSGADAEYSVLPYFSYTDCDVAAGEVAKPKFSIGTYGHIALLTDTEGNMIGLHSMG